MVERQIVARGITDERILDALRRVPRHRFVPEDVVARAYEDGPLPLGHGQTISQPFIVAFMTQALELSEGDRVLDVGTGCGYQATVIGELAGEVHSIEIVPALAKRAKRTMEELGCQRVQVHRGDGYRGWPERAPYDAILVAAAATHVPQPLVDQLAVGGRLVMPVGETDQVLVLVQRTERGLEREAILAVRFVPMTGEARTER